MKSISVAAMLASLAVLSACSDPQGPKEATPQHVGVVVAKEETRALVRTLTGEIQARVQSDLSFRVSGKIVERLVDVGERVGAGQLLARIEAEEQQADLEVAVANLQAAEAQQTQAQLAFDRQQRLFNAQVVSRAILDQAQETLLVAQGSTNSAQAQLETARDSLSYTELRADADGIITARKAEVGQVAQAAEVVFSLAHDGPRDAVFDVVETLFLGAAMEPVVTVTLLSDPSVAIKGGMREVSPTIDPATGTIRVKVGLDGEATMPLGAPVAGSFLHQPRSVIRLPWSAMASDDGQPAVWQVDPATSRVSLKAIAVDDFETGSFTVRTGVSPGDIVVSNGTKFLRTDQGVSYDEGAAR
ncbi:efflux RND transporter periplasmic adaptor subunit [Rhizobium sp. TRM95111]|uniref:efflux RND transporter periplasmic adaptor subunit n=1 Tax=Rhizobium alarense TaxID=2846851 RepID=UPI001F2F28D6|nr:efflux RND transporter periplasmic adaptor subunit [Rhizobium alarense]MCF3642477.1 efflux RND transporter periplasmic adaptor subunit [Rhizobium alarense]